MAVKRGVSLYSYQQAYLLGKLDLEGCVRTAVQTTGADGIELIYEQMPVECYPGPVYPDISREGVARWKDLMEKYKTTPTCMDSFIDAMLYKGRILTVQEQVQMMVQDLKLASKLGFYCIRVLALVAPEVLEQALPAAEYYGVAMGLEVHPPHVLDSPWIQRVAELARKHQTKYIGLIPDFGIFCRGLNSADIYAAQIMGESQENIDYVLQGWQEKVPVEEMIAYLKSMGAGERLIPALRQADRMNRYNSPELLKELADVIVHFHGKFYRMNEDCVETSINYEEPVKLLGDIGWDGYICSEFEGQRAYHAQNCPYEEDEIEQVRRHHVMLKKLIGQ